MWFKFNTIIWLILLPGYLSQDLEYLREALPGEPGVDYPIFSLPPPETSFDCSDKVRLDAECRKLLCKKYSFRLKYERTLANPKLQFVHQKFKSVRRNWALY